MDMGFFRGLTIPTKGTPRKINMNTITLHQGVPYGNDLFPLRDGVRRYKRSTALRFLHIIRGFEIPARYIIYFASAFINLAFFVHKDGLDIFFLGSRLISVSHKRRVS